MSGTVIRQTGSKAIIKMSNEATVEVKRLGSRVFVTAYNWKTGEAPKTVKHTYEDWGVAHAAFRRIVGQFTR